MREAVYQLRVFLGVKDIPHLSLAQLPALMLPGVIIVRVYLNRQLLPCVYQLYQYRQAAVLGDGRMLAYIIRPHAHHIRELPSAVRT